MKRFNIEIEYPRWEDDGIWLKETESETGSWVSAKDALALEARVAELEAAMRDSITAARYGRADQVEIILIAALR